MVKCKNDANSKEVDEKKKVLQISEEISFVQKLADNDVRMRDRAVRRLKRWLYGKTKNGPSFSKDDQMILWRGLFYCMWNSDKLLVQEQLCENMGSLVHSIVNNKDVLLFIDGFLSTIRYEWTFIDNYRMDKYKMLVRRVLRQMMLRVSTEEWILASELGKLLWENILNFNKVPPPPIGLAFHVSEIYLQEIAKCSSKNEVPVNALLDLLRPFVQCIASNKTDNRLQAIIKESVFGYLINQSDVGIEQEEKIRAWKQMGYPAITLDQIEKVEDDSDDDSEQLGDSDDEGDDSEVALDPRAGQTNVELPQIKFDSNKIADMVDEFLADKKLNSKTKHSLKSVSKMFRDLAQNIHPKPFEVPVKEDEVGYLGFKPRKSAKRAAENLMRFEEELMKDSAKARRKRKAGFEPIEEPDAGLEEEEDLSSFKPAQTIETPSKKAPSPKVDEPPAKKRRRSSLGLISNWEITEKSEEVDKDKQAKVSSPGNVGKWDVVSESNPEPALKNGVASEWDKPLQEGEYEFFVSPKKSPKRRSLSKASLDQEVAAEEPLTEGKENVARSPLTLVFNAKLPENQESPKSSRSAKPEEPCIESSPVGALRKARVSMPLNTKSLDLTPVARKGLLIPALTNSAKKRVSIRLEHNKAQEVHEYVKQLRASPHNPHDGSKKPTQGLLKGSPTPFKSAMEKFRLKNLDLLYK